MGVKLNDGLEDAEWNTISKEKQSWGKKASMKSFHINVSVNMKHHMNLEGKHTESKMEIAEKQSLWLPLLVIKNPPCQSLVMVPWKFDFCSSKENCLDYALLDLSYARKMKSGQTSSKQCLIKYPCMYPWIFMDTSLITTPVVISTIFQMLIFYVFSEDRLHEIKSILLMSSKKDFFLKYLVLFRIFLTISHNKLTYHPCDQGKATRGCFSWIFSRGSFSLFQNDNCHCSIWEWLHGSHVLETSCVQDLNSFHLCWKDIVQAMYFACTDKKFFHQKVKKCKVFVLNDLFCRKLKCLDLDFEKKPTLKKNILI